MAHEELKAQYAADALWHPRPWELWEWKLKWSNDYYVTPLGGFPVWSSDYAYRRKAVDTAKQKAESI